MRKCTREELIAFEQEIAELFNTGQIRAPIHLDGGNEDALINVFESVNEEDWIAGSWRQHYKCLLKGVPPQRLKADIVAGRSITLCYPDFKIISSAIVGGILPIALGIAHGLKRDFDRRLKQSGFRHSDAKLSLPSYDGPRVHVFLGDMTAHTGIAHECVHYAMAHQLPIRWVVEDNGKSVCTPTVDVWGTDEDAFDYLAGVEVKYIGYTLPFPHSGAGKRIQF